MILKAVFILQLLVISQSFAAVAANECEKALSASQVFAQTTLNINFMKNVKRSDKDAMARLIRYGFIVEGSIVRGSHELQERWRGENAFSFMDDSDREFLLFPTEEEGSPDGSRRKIYIRTANDLYLISVDINHRLLEMFRRYVAHNELAWANIDAPKPTSNIESLPAAQTLTHTYRIAPLIEQPQVERQNAFRNPPLEKLLLWETITDEMVKNLNDPEFRYPNLPHIVRIKMPSGHIFKRILDHNIFGKLGVAWLDESANRIWSAAPAEDFTGSEAEKFCKDLTGQELPSDTEFEELASHLGQTFSLPIRNFIGQDFRSFWTDRKFSYYGHQSFITITFGMGTISHGQSAYGGPYNMRHPSLARRAVRCVYRNTAIDRFLARHRVVTKHSD